MKPQMNYLPKLHALAKEFAGGADAHELLHETAVAEGIIRESLKEIAYDWTACSQLLRKVRERHGVRSLPKMLDAENYLRSEADVRRYVIDHLMEMQEWAAMSIDVSERIIRALDVLREKYSTRALQKKRADWLMERMKKVGNGRRAVPMDALKEALDVYLDKYAFDREKKEQYLAGIIRNVAERRKRQGRETGSRRSVTWLRPSSTVNH